jgi:hypothetical protein
VILIRIVTIILFIVYYHSIQSPGSVLPLFGF